MKNRENGVISGALIATICLIIAVVLVSMLAIWLYFQYADAKDNVDTKVAEAVADAEKTTRDEARTEYAELLKDPYADFVGPDDYGRVTFKYPKTWSSYIDKDASTGGDYQAYLHPGVVPSVNPSQPFALRVTITEQTIENQLKKYEGLVKKGDLKSSAVSANGQGGTRLDGAFTKDIRGSAVYFKVRDKTLIIQTDISTSDMTAEFDKLIKTITFNT